MKFEEDYSGLIEELSKKITKIRQKYVFSYLGIFVGIVIILFAIYYFILNPDIVGGVISLILIGMVVIVINVISYLQRRKSVENLQKDIDQAIKKENEQNKNEDL